ncbi:zinc ribbon domain-containing protein [Phototrophicus methaneseepsis]|uniref:Zinc ribbon domain-containing protein n=1 Tax=Phototrophicus methaneseepsis TaxID=2710758 RepID=A0A7S8IC35_9CHLR|nr:zinc ribbon domain-containing protein [Phototrophicus methaneseepsis]QPC81120.1 zinc ribbon domain-containing protein [Phototrophicus methaneseepsis]
MDNLDTGVLIAIVYGGVVIAAFWLAMIIWAYRDMRARSRDGLASLLVGVMVAILTVPGLFIYIMLRPRETLSEAYERSLEEEALLQEIEEKAHCPGCGQRVDSAWQACPSCHTRLKRPCRVCNHLLELSWEICPYCASPQNQYIPEDAVVNTSRHVARRAPEPPAISDKWLANSGTSSTTQGYAASDVPQYVDDNY